MAKVRYKDIKTQIISTQQLERNITEHKIFYKNHLRKISNRHLVLNKLSDYHTELDKIQLGSPFYINTQLITLGKEIEAFLKSTVGDRVLQFYNSKIPQPPSTRKIPSAEESFWGSLFGTLAASMETETLKYKQEWNFKKKFLLFLRTSIENFGLHPDILRRNPEIYKRYNVILRHDFKSRKEFVESKILLNKNDLETDFLSPYSNQLPIKINGKLIPLKNICSIKYTSTLLQDDELELFALKNGFQWHSDFRDTYAFAMICTDETDLWHTNPFLNSNSYFLRNSLSIYIDPNRINELKKIKSKQFDLTRLIGLCEELNKSSAAGNHVAVSLLVRALIDHIPPIFHFQSFADFANQYGGTKSFKKSMLNLNSSLRNLADANIHTQARDKEVLPNAVQSDFTPELDLLLSEVVRKLK
jgi:hypothetical protein